MVENHKDLTTLLGRVVDPGPFFGIEPVYLWRRAKGCKTERKKRICVGVFTRQFWQVAVDEEPPRAVE